MGMLHFVRSAGRLALDVVLPPRCLTCDAGVEAPGRLCAACFGITDFVTDPCCVQCGQPFAHAGQGGLSMTCARCASDPPSWRQARAALRYNDQTKRILLPFKYQDRVETAQALALHMARAGAGLLRQAEVLVPVPLHRSRLRARRYNQSALLARAIGRLAGRPVALDALRRVRATEKLEGKAAAERMAIVAGVFAVRPGREGRIAGRHVLLIDDVLTTGATATGCARTLLAAGAAQVDLLVAARVPDLVAD
ncbi:MAG: ComF family protein [Acetobacteraceae bacterium]